MTAVDRTCPACGALPGKPCLQPKGQVSRVLHAARVRGAARTRDLAYACRQILHTNSTGAP